MHLSESARTSMLKGIGRLGFQCLLQEMTQGAISLLGELSLRLGFESRPCQPHSLASQFDFLGSQAGLPTRPR